MRRDFSYADVYLRLRYRSRLRGGYELNGYPSMPIGRTTKAWLSLRPTIAAATLRSGRYGVPTTFMDRGSESHADRAAEFDVSTSARIIRLGRIDWFTRRANRAKHPLGDRRRATNPSLGFPHRDVGR